MRKLFFLFICLLIPVMVFAGRNPYVENVKSKHKEIIGKSKLFKVVGSLYDTEPSTQGEINTYELKLKVKNRVGEAVFTFVKHPAPASTGQNEKDILPQYQTLTLKVEKYVDKTKSMDKKATIPLHLAEPENVAVFRGQALTITWYGDGGMGERGFHLFSYLEKVQ